MRKSHNRRGAALCLILAILITVTGCGGISVNSNLAEPRSYRLLYATDLHFYAPELVGDFERFSRDLTYGDGKVAQYSFEIVQTLIDTALREKPDALLLGGDLSLNGAYESHNMLANMLKPVYDAGIPVLVVPGNHDINQLSAFRYADGDYCATIDEKDFGKLYGALGMNSAISRDKNSLSYMYSFNDEVYLMMIDSCDYDGIGRSTGSVSDKTLKWIESQLKSAKKAGATVISVSHHNLLQHSPLWGEPFVMSDSSRLLNLLEQYGVKLNLTGHMHIQHILRAETADGLSEAATGSLAVYPNNYSIIDVGTDKRITYKAESLDVAGWAAKSGSQDANLLDFANYSQSFFDTTSRNKLTDTLESYQVSEDELSQMIDFAELINRSYFAGTHDTVHDALLQHPGYALWAKYSEQEFFAGYIDSILSDTAAEHVYLAID